MHHHDVRHIVDGRDRRDVAEEIEIELVVQGRVDRVESAGHEQRVAVCGRAHDRLGCDVAAGSRTVVDDERLTEPLGEPLTYQARRDVRTASGREANNDAHRTRWIGLRPSNTRHGREGGSAGGQTQELSAGKFHCQSLHGVQSGADGGANNLLPFLRTQKGNDCYWYLADIRRPAYACPVSG